MFQAASQSALVIGIFGSAKSARPDLQKCPSRWQRPSFSVARRLHGPRNQSSEVVRFVLWLTVVAALAAAWWVDRQRLEAAIARYKTDLHMSRAIDSIE